MGTEGQHWALHAHALDQSLKTEFHGRSPSQSSSSYLRRKSHNSVLTCPMIVLCVCVCVTWRQRRSKTPQPSCHWPSAMHCCCPPRWWSSYSQQILKTKKKLLELPKVRRLLNCFCVTFRAPGCVWVIRGILAFLLFVCLFGFLLNTRVKIYLMQNLKSVFWANFKLLVFCWSRRQWSGDRSYLVGWIESRLFHSWEICVRAICGKSFLRRKEHFFPQQMYNGGILQSPVMYLLTTP